MTSTFRRFSGLFVWPWHSRSHLRGLLPISSYKKDLLPAPSPKKNSQSSREHTSASPSTFPLRSLPPELIMPVLDHLDVVSRVCLKYTSRAYSFSIPSVNQSRLSRCEKWLITCRFETDLLEYPDKVVCTLSNGLVCKPSPCGQIEDYRRLKRCMRDGEGERCCTTCPFAYLSTYPRHGPLPPTVALYHNGHHLRKSRFYWGTKTGCQLEIKGSLGMRKVSVSRR